MPKSRRNISPVALRVEIAKFQLRQFDVANRAGISEATLSKFLRERYGLSPENAERVAQVVHELIAERRGARASA